MIVDLLIVSAAAAFVLSLIERWYSLNWIRGVVAVLVSAPAMFWVFNYPSEVALYLTVAASFVSLVMLLGAERLATEPPIIVDSRSRR